MQIILRKFTMVNDTEEIMNQKKNDDSRSQSIGTVKDDDLIQTYSRVIDGLNEAFHHNYSQAISKRHGSLGRRQTPAIIVSGDHVTLFYDGKKEQELIIPPLYQEVKSISHLSFGIYVTLTNNGYGPLAQEMQSDLTYQLELINEGLAILDQLDIPSEFVALQRDMLSLSAEILGDVLERRVIEEERVNEFGRVSAPLYLNNAALAARLELDELHRVINRWQKQIDPEDWQKVYVVICAAHQARYRETTRQYFQRLFHEIESIDAKDENRVIYAENIYDNEAALLLLARHLVDQKTSIALFEDRKRLQEDLMADGAAAYLEVLFAE
jgi:hypothetical protein